MSQVINLEEEVRSLLGRILERDPADIAPDALLVQDLGMDSMMALEIIASLEKKYKIRLPEQELQHVTTLGQVVEIAKRYVR